MKKHSKYIITVALLLIVLIAVWLFSQQEGFSSEKLSNDLTIKIINFFSAFGLGKLVQKFFYYIDIRKIAHVALFAVIGFLIIYLIPLKQVCKRVIIALIAGFALGAADEMHQLFVQGRTADLMDVLIDLTGVCIGVGLALICRKIYHKISKKHNKA